MQKVEKMSIAVPPEMAPYARRWKAASQAARAREVEALRRAWQEGIESGPATSLVFIEVKGKGRAALARGRSRAR